MRRTPGEEGALRRHEHILDLEVMSPRAAHTSRIPRVEKLDLRDRHEEIPRFRLSVLQPHVAILDDLRVHRDPGRVSATGAEALPARDAVASGGDDRPRRRTGAVRYHAAR